MPHMSNLPWLNIYCFLFCSVLLVVTSFSLPSSMMMMKSHKENMKNLKNFKWTW